MKLADIEAAIEAGVDLAVSDTHSVRRVRMRTPASRAMPLAVRQPRKAFRRGWQQTTENDGVLVQMDSDGRERMVTPRLCLAPWSAYAAYQADLAADEERLARERAEVFRAGRAAQQALGYGTFDGWEIRLTVAEAKVLVGDRAWLRERLEDLARDFDNGNAGSLFVGPGGAEALRYAADELRKVIRNPRGGLGS